MNYYKEGDKLLVLNEYDDTEHIVQVNDVDKDSESYTYKYRCLYCSLRTFNFSWIDNDDIKIIKKVTDSDIDAFREENDIKFKIGDAVKVDGEIRNIELYDTDDNEYLLDNNEWYDEDLEAIEDKEVAHLFKVGDLVKPKEYTECVLKIDNFFDDGDIEVSCVVGNYGRIEDYYKLNDLESATQAEIDILQKDFLFKVGEKVLYGEDRTEDYILSIDTDKNTDLPYYLGESFDYVSEKEIFKIDKKVEVACKKADETEVKQEIRPRRRLLLG